MCACVSQEEEGIEIENKPVHRTKKEREREKKKKKKLVFFCSAKHKMRNMKCTIC